MINHKMKTRPRLSGKNLEDLVDKICKTYHDEIGINHADGHDLPRTHEIIHLIEKLDEIIFPGFSSNNDYTIASMPYHIGHLLTEIHSLLIDLMIRACCFDCAEHGNENCDVSDRCEKSAAVLLDSLPELRESMKLDIEAAFAGDPAAASLNEIVLSYPGLRAITIQRFAHQMYHERIPLLPRMLTEYAHSQTGIDIHPGAHLGKGIFIDHGTGVVIGETCQIGDNVKIYQGVTLGALSFPKDSCGLIIKGQKRHPTIEDNVTIYAGASVLGDIVIGKNSIIGGNVWLTESLPPHTRIIISPPEQKIRTKHQS
ncbi:MAG: hypothetical protein PHV75_02540 [Victivallaceae bacterium]|nr:hypothetical protein [Victivallaceae bacterium]MDD4317378.1 hypothetical protein [Victivallaceae bacterium]NLK83201.1 serine acetyltransferase [Lentisphaerota bacterium]